MIRALACYPRGWAMPFASLRAVLAAFGRSPAVSALRVPATIAGALPEILCILACLAIWGSTFYAIGRL